MKMDKAKKDLRNSLGRSPSPSDARKEASCWYCSPEVSLFLPDCCNQGSKKYSAFRQKTFDDDVLTPEASNILKDACAGACMHHALLRQADLEDHTPKVTTFKIPEGFGNILDKQVSGPTTENLTISDFPVQSFKPKVQIAFQRLPGQCPRAVKVERTRRLYLTFDVAELLAREGIDSNELMSRHYDPHNTPTAEIDPFFPIYLPLEIFDDYDYDCRTPEDWISLGLEPGSHDRKPVPGRALLPTDDVLGHEDPKSLNLFYEWIDVGVLDYDKNTELYLVHKTDKNGHVQDEEGRPILNGGITPEGRAPLLSCQYWVPRVRLFFLAEDPRVFARRVVSANNLRRKAEALIRYQLYLDCMPTQGVTSISEESLQRIQLLAVNNPQLQEEERVLDHLCHLEKEVRLEYERTMNKMIFDDLVTCGPCIISYVTLPDKEEEKIPEKGLIWIPDYPFEEQKANFNSLSFLTRPEVIVLLMQVQDECNKVASMCLFNSTLAKHICLEEFEQIQTETFTQVQAFLKDTWISTLTTAVKSNLSDAAENWYDLEESNWDDYQVSKLHNLMKRLRFSLQDSLRYLVQNSLISFTQLLLGDCHGVLNCSEDMEWGDDLITSPYKPQRNPLFVTELVLDSSGVLFSPPVDSFEKSLMSLFDTGILVTHTIPQLEKYVLENIPITGTPLLDSVGLHEPEVEELREAMRSAIQKARIPLQAYAKKYEKFLELNNNDIQYFLRDYEEQCPSAQEVMGIVDMHLSKKENTHNTLPSSIVIGPFHVTVKGVKQNLSKKYQELATAMLDLLARNLHLRVQKICDTYETVSSIMQEKPNSIEELTELREWMKGVPEQLAVQEELIHEVMEDYKVMEIFLYSLSDEDSNDKWAASYWPVKITLQTQSIQLQHEEDEDKFCKAHIIDQNGFQDKLEDMELTVGGLSVQVDVNQAHELAKRVRWISKEQKELQDLAALYNNRERIFGMQIADYSKLSRMVEEFQPYYDLWTTVSDWMQWNESWMNGPLMEIESEQLQKNVSDSSETMQRCVKQFKDSPACLGVAVEFQDKIEEFKRYVPLIQGLLNPDMRSRHWEMLSKDTNIDIKLGPSLTLGYCLDMNLLDHIETIIQVAETAGKEYPIENALDKMESEWNSVSFTVTPYKDTGTFILENTDEASQLLSDQTVMVQSLSLSLFKNHFEERMNTWKNKLKLTQDVLEEWLKCQHSWLYLEPIFRLENIKSQLPLESQHYQAVDEDWRNIMKNANENPKVISLCPDPTLLENLQKCNELQELVQKGLSEYLESKRGDFPRFQFLSDNELLEMLSQKTLLLSEVLGPEQ